MEDLRNLPGTSDIRSDSDSDNTEILEYTCDSDYDSDIDKESIIEPVSVSSEPLVSASAISTFNYFKEAYLEVLAGSIQLSSEDSQFYWAQHELENSTAIEHFITELVSLFSYMLIDESAKDDTQGTISILHSIHSLLHNTKLQHLHQTHPLDCMGQLLDILILSLMSPMSRCGSDSYSYILRDRIARIIVVFFEHFFGENLWTKTLAKLIRVFDTPSFDISCFIPQYGALLFLLYLNKHDVFKGIFDTLIRCDDKAREAAFNNLPSRQIAINMRNILNLMYKNYMTRWFNSPSADSDMIPIANFLLNSDPHVVDYLCHFRAESVPYIFPVLCMNKRMHSDIYESEVLPPWMAILLRDIEEKKMERIVKKPVIKRKKRKVKRKKNQIKKIKMGKVIRTKFSEPFFSPWTKTEFEGTTFGSVQIVQTVSTSVPSVIHPLDPDHCVSENIYPLNIRVTPRYNFPTEPIAIRGLSF